MRPALARATLTAGSPPLSLAVYSRDFGPAEAERLLWRAGFGPRPGEAAAFDFELRLSRLRVPAGRVYVELVNFGEDEHDLHIRRIGGPRTFTIPGVAPGERATINLRLGAGRYRIWCHVGDHARRGMTATLRVVKPTRGRR